MGKKLLLQPKFLPMTRSEMETLGWDELDILFVSGDAYVDHPSFGIALLGRWLLSRGFRVGVVAQPAWRDRDAAIKAVTAMGRPRLFAGVTAGAIDSMLAHYTAFRKKRSDDAYTPGGQAGARPNRAVIMYSGLVKQAFSALPVVIGGIEASLRRISHYDFWDDSLRRSILLDSKADFLVYGMGETALLEIAYKAEAMAVAHGQVDRKLLVEECQDVAGIVFSIAANKESSFPCSFGGSEHIPVAHLSSHEKILAEPSLLMKVTLDSEQQVHQGHVRLVQASGDRLVIVNPPALALSQEDMDDLYGLPYTRFPHPSYTSPIPAWEMIRTSITTHRGCGGGCSFCSLALHQGRKITSRGATSIVAEATAIAAQKSAQGVPLRWAGSISDVGGPSANMWQAGCKKKYKRCERVSCMHPDICRHFQVNQMDGVKLLREIAQVQGVRHVRVASGVRFDLALKDRPALFGYTAEFTGGQLKVAPEHSHQDVLGLMRKPGVDVFEEFLRVFFSDSAQAGKEQYTIPYLISAFPGCSMEHMRNLKDWLVKRKWQPQQVQCFIPTPGTVATAMFYGKITPAGQPLFVARSDQERMAQHYLLLGAQKRDVKKNSPRERSGFFKAGVKKENHSPQMNTALTKNKPSKNTHRKVSQKKG